MKKSEQVGELVTALAKAQAEFTPALKDSKNPYYNSKYADLASVIGAVRPALNKNGIILTQDLSADLDRQVAIVKTSLYCGEQFFEIEIEAPAKGQSKKDEQSGTPGIKFDVQTIGAATLYLRRYSVAAICGLAAEDDEEDDGNSLDNDNNPIQKKTLCPNCGKDTIIKGKPEYGGGWVCYSKKGGCGAKFTDEEWKSITTPQSDQVQESHQNIPSGDYFTPSPAQQGTQPGATAPASSQGQAGKLKFLPPNGLIAVVKSVKEIEARPASEGHRAIKPFLAVEWLGTHNGVNGASCFDSKYWPLIKASVGLECHFQIKEKDAGEKHYINIEDVIYRDGQEVTYVEGVLNLDGQPTQL